MSVDQKTEISRELLLRNVSSLTQRLGQALENPETHAMIVVGCGMLCFAFPSINETIFLGGLGFAWYGRNRQKWRKLPLAMPKSSGKIDPRELDPKTKKPKPADGIYYLGNEKTTNDEIWLTNTQIRTHLLFIGTTGSGKAQPLDATVWTVDGPAPMGSIKKGAWVLTPDGASAEVIGVFPQGILGLRRIELEGGYATRACRNHLWKAEIEGVVAIVNTDDLEEALAADLVVRIPRTETPGSGQQKWLRIVRIEDAGEALAQCIRIDHPEHLYITDDGIVTHNTEYLISTVFNALIQGSGFIYVDGKADTSLYGKIYSMARLMGREDDVLLINFQTGAKDIFGPQPTKTSNTTNPFAIGSSGMLTELVVSLMSSGGDGKGGDMWKDRAISFVGALMRPLVFMRDKYGVMLDVSIIRSYFPIERIEDLYWRGEARYPGLRDTLDGMKAYIENLPGYDNNNIGNQGEDTRQQHGFITMQLVRAFNSLADTYGYIMRTPLAEIDFLDVFINRRILVVLLPALEKSPPELSNLGRIIVAATKATMAVGLGSLVEGEWKKIIDAKPTNAPSPYPAVFDEYGYYSVEGFAVVPAQARSLGFSAIFAGQDLPAFKKSSEEEAKSTLANTTTKFCGYLECTETYNYFRDRAGEAFYVRTGGYENTPGLSASNYQDMQTGSVEKMYRVAMDDLSGQATGEWHMFRGTSVVPVSSFYLNPPTVKWLRTNHLIRVGRPSLEAKDFWKDMMANAPALLCEEGGLEDRIGSLIMKEAPILKRGFDYDWANRNQLERTVGAMFYLADEDNRKLRDFQNAIAAGGGGGNEEDDEIGQFFSTGSEISISNATEDPQNGGAKEFFKNTDKDDDLFAFSGEQVSVFGSVAEPGAEEDAPPADTTQNFIAPTDGVLDYLTTTDLMGQIENAAGNEEGARQAASNVGDIAIMTQYTNSVTSQEKEAIPETIDVCMQIFDILNKKSGDTK